LFLMSEVPLQGNTFLMSEVPLQGNTFLMSEVPLQGITGASSFRMHYEMRPPSIDDVFSHDPASPLIFFFFFIYLKPRIE